MLIPQTGEPDERSLSSCKPPSPSKPPTGLLLVLCISCLPTNSHSYHQASEAAQLAPSATCPFHMTVQHIIGCCAGNAGPYPPAPPYLGPVLKICLRCSTNLVLFPSYWSFLSHVGQV